LEAFLEQYGYLAVTFGTFVEGEAALLAGAFMANQGILNFFGVVAAAILGSQITDWMYFLLGRTKGTQFLEKRPGLRKKTSKVYRFVEKYPNTILLLYRYMYGFRTVIPLVIGLSKISTLRFWLIGMIGTLTWAFGFAFLGFWLGKAVEGHIAQLSAYKWHLLVSFVAVIFLVVFITKWRKKRNADDGKGN
jgi:membrane protein DedA with SNARE-associated domain